jgi:hypothetical protein
LTARVFYHQQGVPFDDSTFAETGCLIHPQYTFIGASPDGLQLYNQRLLEIKNVVSRVITGVPSLEYWVQMQTQLEVCDVEECDFVESKFVEVLDTPTFVTRASEYAYCGIIVHQPGEDPNQLYSPMGHSAEACVQWLLQTQQRLHGGGSGNDDDDERLCTVAAPSVTYWILETLCHTVVRRNRDWFLAILPKATALWHEWQRQKETLTLVPKVVRKRKEEPVCIIRMDDIV